MFAGCGVIPANEPFPWVTAEPEEDASVQAEEGANGAAYGEEDAVVEEEDAVTMPAPESPDEEIEITLENLFHYFQYFTEERWKENSFGETGKLELAFFLRIRPEYAYRLVAVSTEIAVEYDFRRTPIPITVYFDEHVYELYEEQVHPESISRMVLDEHMDYQYTELPERIYGLCIAFTTVETDFATVYLPYPGPEILRVQGTLCLRAAA